MSSRTAPVIVRQTGSLIIKMLQGMLTKLSALTDKFVRVQTHQISTFAFLKFKRSFSTCIPPFLTPIRSARLTLRNISNCTLNRPFQGRSLLSSSNPYKSLSSWLCRENSNLASCCRSSPSRYSLRTSAQNGPFC